MFSTADLLMESYLSEGRSGRQFLSINLNHRVQRLEVTGTRVTGVVARDLVADKIRTYRARQVCFMQEV
jgi:predicted oxidoreductase